VTKTIALVVAAVGFGCAGRTSVVVKPAVSNPIPVDIIGGLSGRYRFGDGSVRINFDPQDVLRIPLHSSNGDLPAGAYELYVGVTDDTDPAGRRSFEVGLADSLALVTYSVPTKDAWVGPIRLSTHRATRNLELRGTGLVRLRGFFVVPRGGGPPTAANVIQTQPSRWETLWIDVVENGDWISTGDTASLRIRSAGTTTRKTDLDCAVLDFHHTVVAKRRYTVVLDGNESTIDVPVPQAFGPYLVRCAAQVSVGRIEYQRVIARVAAPVSPQSPILGGHGNHALMERVGASWNREFEAQAKVEQRTGHVKRLRVFDRPLSEHWLFELTAEVRAGRGHVDAWEIFNEPYHALEGDWIAQHVQAVRSAVEVIHREAPGTLVVSGGPPEEVAPALAWWQAMGDAGLFRSLDVISVHLYVGSGGTEPLDTDPTFHAYASAIRKIVDEHGGGGKPIWDTESGFAPNETFYIDRSVAYGTWGTGGFTERPPVPYAIGAAMVVRLFLLHAWHQMPWFYYQGTSAFGNSWSIVDYDGAPLPLAVALAQVARTMRDARPDGVPTLPDGLWGLSFWRHDQRVVSLWSIERGRTYRIADVPAGVEVLDMFANRTTVPRALGPEPIFLVGTASAVDRALARITGRP
jgi:hypothetical protein